MGISAKKFVESLSAHSILSTGELSTIRDQIPADKLETDGEFLARDLIKAGKLTKYQASNVYQGRGKGLVFGDYVVLDKLGAGGMGQVFKAQHRRMKRVVALKVLPSQATKTERNVKRFYQEVEVAAQLTHPNIVTSFDAGESHGLHYLVMEYVEGKDLSSYVSQHGTLSVEQSVNCILQAARGLEYAHGRGIIHRDIKPSNLLLDRNGVVKILDMGLARSDSTSGESGGSELTESGQVMGTAEYMSPEQAQDARTADFRSDIYSLGCSLFRILIGRPPYTGETSIQKILAHREQPIPSLRALRPDVPDTLDKLFQAMVAKKVDDRITPMSAVVKALEAISAGVNADEASVVLGAEDLGGELNQFLSSISSGSGGSSSMVGRKKSATENKSATEMGSQTSLSGDSQLHVPQAAGMPRWVPIAAGGGVAALVLIVVLIVMFSRGGDEPQVAANNTGATTNETKEEEQAKPPEKTEKPESKTDQATTKVTPDNKVDFSTAEPVKAALDFTKPIDLLAQIDPKRDGVQGKWKFDNEVLVTASGNWDRMQIPVTPPEEYDLAVTFERAGGGGGFLVGLPWKGSQPLVIVDGWAGKVSGLQWIDAKQADANETRLDGQVLSSGPNEIVCSVRKNGVLATCNGNPFVRWTGDPKRLSLGPETKVPMTSQPFLGTFGSPFRVSKLEFRPPDRKQDSVLSSTTPLVSSPAAMPLAPPQELKATGTTDLIALVDPVKHRRDGTWTKEGSVLVSPMRNGPWSFIVIPAIPPDEYDLTLTIDPKEVGDPVCIGLFVQGRPAAAMIDPKNAGLELVDNEGYRSNWASRRLPAITINKATTITCAVRKGRVFAFVDKALAFDWSGDPADLTLPSWMSKSDKQMFLSYNGSCRFSNFEVAPPTAKPPVYGPVDLLAAIDVKRDTVRGESRRDGLELLLDPIANGPQVVLPVTYPNEYELTAVVEFTGGPEHTLIMAVPGHGTRASITIDGTDRTASGLQAYGPNVYTNGPLTYKEPWLTSPDRVHTVVGTMRRDSISAFCDGKQLFTWTKKIGGLREDGAPCFSVSDIAAAFIGGNNSGWRISKLDLVPLNWKKLPMPPTSDRAKAIEATAKLVETANAKNASTDVKRLGAEMLVGKAASELANPTDRFALLEESLRLAIEAGDLPLALHAADQLATVFEVDARANEKRLLDVFKGNRPAAAKQALLGDARKLIDRAIQNERFELAIDLQAAILASLPKTGTGALDLQKEFKTLGVELGVWKAEYDAYAAALEGLKKKADDSEAHAAVGRYLCLVVGDWREGAAHLEKSTDVVLQAIARQEIDGPKGADQQAALADAWWGLFEKATGSARWIPLERAASWYRRAAPTLTGKAKTTMDQRRTKLTAERKLSNYAFAGRHPLDAVKIGDRWYKFYAEPTRWHLAAGICDRMGGTLAILDTPAKNDAVSQYALSQLTKSEQVTYWIGGSDEDKEGEFRWLDGSMVGSKGYSNWQGGQPNNANGSEDWMGVYARLEKGQLKTEWADWSTQSYPFVCEWDR